jgi:Tfp pilus assembly protein PilN
MRSAGCLTCEREFHVFPSESWQLAPGSLHSFTTRVYPFNERGFLPGNMTTRLNLSSRPFRNRALPWTVTTIVTVVSLIAIVWIAKSTIQTNAQAQAVQKEVIDLRKRSDDLNGRVREIKTALTPEQERALKSTHALVDRKVFSWSRLFADLEAVLPGTVRVEKIAVKQVGTSGDRTIANLDLTVVSKNPATVTQMIADMQQGGVFQSELRSVNLQRGREESGAEYEMNVRYSPRLGVAIDESDPSNRPVDTAPANRSKPK